MNKNGKLLLLIGLLLIFVILPSLVLAQTPPDQEPLPTLKNINQGLANVANESFAKDQPAGSNYENYVFRLVGRGVNIFTSFVGVVLAILIIYSGWLWMTASGNEDQVTKAKGILKNSVIALIIILAAWMITEFLLGTINLKQPFSS